jgi:hypothetical protein
LLQRSQASLIDSQEQAELIAGHECRENSAKVKFASGNG